jgi:hypothetical protein
MIDVWKSYWFWHIGFYNYATLPHSFISSNRGLVESLGFSTYRILLYEKRNNWTSSLPIYMSVSLSFASLLWLKLLVLNKNSESRYNCFVPDLIRIAFRFSQFSIMLTMGLSDTVFIL